MRSFFSKAEKAIFHRAIKSFDSVLTAALLCALFLTVIFYPGLWSSDTRSLWGFGVAQSFDDWFPFGLPVLMGLFHGLGRFLKWDAQTILGSFTFVQCFLFWWGTFSSVRTLSGERGSVVGWLVIFGLLFIFWPASLAQVTNTWGLIFFQLFIIMSLRWARQASLSGPIFWLMLLACFCASAVRHEVAASCLLFCALVVWPVLYFHHRNHDRGRGKKKMAFAAIGLLVALGTKSMVTVRLKSHPSIHSENMFLSYDLFGTLYHGKVTDRELATYEGTRKFGLPKMSEAVRGYGSAFSIDYLMLKPGAPFVPWQLLTSRFVLRDLPRAIWLHPLGFLLHKRQIWRQLLQVEDYYNPGVASQEPVPRFLMSEASLFPAWRESILDYARESRDWIVFEGLYRHGWLLAVTTLALLIAWWLAAGQDQSAMWFGYGAAVSQLIPHLLVTPADQWRYLMGANLFLQFALGFSVVTSLTAVAWRVRAGLSHFRGENPC